MLILVLSIYIYNLRIENKPRIDKLSNWAYTNLLKNIFLQTLQTFHYKRLQTFIYSKVKGHISFQIGSLVSLEKFDENF